MDRRIARSRLPTRIATAFAIYGFVATAAGAEVGDPFATWPQTWTDTYRRFEKFIVAQAEAVPPSGLEILPDGTIAAKYWPGMNDPERSPGIVLFAEGCSIGDRSTKGKLALGAPPRYAASGTYAACFRIVAKPLGYQFIHPLKWFRTKRGPSDGATRSGDDLSFEMIDQPEPAMDYWPNERLLRYHDFQVFPGANPLDFFHGNNKVTPSVTLAVTKSGVIQRKRLDDQLENLLEWRIYHNGRLVTNGPAANDLTHQATRGIGSHVAFVGVNGPGGFMPVSNFLQFPLFPEPDGSLAVLPSATNHDRFPDFLVTGLSPDQLAALRTAESKTAPAGGYNSATIYHLDVIGPLADPAKQALMSLWSAWAWSVNLAKEEPSSNINRIHLVGHKGDESVGAIE